MCSLIEPLTFQLVPPQELATKAAICSLLSFSDIGPMDPPKRRAMLADWTVAQPLWLLCPLQHGLCQPAASRAVSWWTPAIIVVKGANSLTPSSWEKKLTKE